MTVYERIYELPQLTKDAKKRLRDVENLRRAMTRNLEAETMPRVIVSDDYGARNGPIGLSFAMDRDAATLKRLHQERLLARKWGNRWRYALKNLLARLYWRLDA